MGSRESRPPEELLEEIDELRASRTRVVLSADTARRRIERELHDSTLQHLVALAVNLQYLGQLLETNVSAASALLKELRRDVHDAVDSLRELAHRVYPPLLLDRGLSDALRAAVLALEVPARLETDGLERHAPELEATVYFSCLDALNAVADAGATRVAIRVLHVDDALVVEVEAAGADSDRLQAGRTLISTRDRVGAFGGRLTVSPAMGGKVRVSATIPEPP